MTTKIEWTDETWNPVTGCTKVSQGCKHCYAERLWPKVSAAEAKRNGYGARRPFTLVWSHAERLEAPLHWRQPRRVFVNSMSDLFHEDVSDDFIDQVFAVMCRCCSRFPEQGLYSHTFQILTKRAERMQRYMADPERTRQVFVACHRTPLCGRSSEPPWPLPNVWLGVSVEDQATADERIPLLLQTPAAVRFVSYEPALDGVSFEKWLPIGWSPTLQRWKGGVAAKPGPFLDWIIVGGESGPGARHFYAAWARDTVAQCKAAGVPCFVKQMGAYVVDRNDAGFDGCEPWEWPLRPDGGDPELEHDIHGYRESHQGADCRIRLVSRAGKDMAEWPADLRVREFPL